MKVKPKIIQSDQGQGRNQGTKEQDLQEQNLQEQNLQGQNLQGQCRVKLQAISKASNLEMYLSAPDGQLSVLVDHNGQQHILTQAENFNELLNTLKAIQVYIAIMKTVVTCKYMEQH